jgi:hypothetical protein
MRRGRLPAGSCRHDQVNSPERLSGRHASPSGITPSNIMSPARSQPGSRTEVRLGARAHNTRPANRAHAPPLHAAVQPRQPRTTRLTCGPCTSKEPRTHPRSVGVGSGRADLAALYGRVAATLEWSARLADEHAERQRTSRRSDATEVASAKRAREAAGRARDLASRMSRDAPESRGAGVIAREHFSRRPAGRGVCSGPSADVRGRPHGSAVATSRSCPWDGAGGRGL